MHKYAYYLTANLQSKKVHLCVGNTELTRGSGAGSWSSEIGSAR
jgi:hypothetical protein